MHIEDNHPVIKSVVVTSFSLPFIGRDLKNFKMIDVILERENAIVCIFEFMLYLFDLDKTRECHPKVLILSFKIEGDQLHHVTSTRELILPTFFV